MASTNFTTHYSIPLPLGTDLTTPMDYNEAAEAVDTALFGAVTDAGNASIAAGNAVNTANAAAEEVDTLGSDLSQEKAKIIALQTRVTNAENEIDDVRADSSDMITAYNEPTATSTHAYAIGDFFIYNNTLYKATAAIAIGATIVPDTNCETTNVSSELIEIKSALTGKKIYTRTVGANETIGEALYTLYSQLNALDNVNFQAARILIEQSSNVQDVFTAVLRNNVNNTIQFSSCSVLSDQIRVRTCLIKNVESDCKFYGTDGTTYSDLTSSTSWAGGTLSICV